MGGLATTRLPITKGTFIGAANLLGYDLNEAMLAATYTMNHLCRNGLPFPPTRKLPDAAWFKLNMCALDCAIYERPRRPAGI